MAAAPKNEVIVSASQELDSAKKAEKHIFQLGDEPTDLGRPDSFRYNILTWVLAERYDAALKELKEFLDRPSDYPDFHEKVNRYINHAIDLVYAIKAKRTFPGIHSLTRAKQSELREKFKEHFRELQYILTRVEKVERDLRINDARSTIYVVRALWFAGVAVVALAFILEACRGLALTSYIVFDDSVGRLANWLFGLIGW